MQELDCALRPRSARNRGLLLRLVAVLSLFSAFGSNHTTAQAVRINRPRPNYFGFVSLTVTATPTTCSFTLTKGGLALGSATISVTTAYTFGVAYNGNLSLYGYFASAANALTGGTPSSSIPSSVVLGKVPTGTPTSFTAFTQTTPFGGASGLQLFNITSISSFSGSRTDVLSLEINLATIPQLPAATYTGTLSLEAQSM